MTPDDPGWSPLGSNCRAMLYAPEVSSTNGTSTPGIAYDFERRLRDLKILGLDCRKRPVSNDITVRSRKKGDPS
jgi:hypothetical protein